MSSDVDKIRRGVRNAFAVRCINLSKDSLSYLTNYVKDLEESVRQKTIERVIGVISQEDDGSSEFLNLDLLKDIIKRSVRGKTDTKEVFKLENVDDWKPVSFEKNSKKFVIINRTPFTKISSFEVLRRRFETIKELLEENEGVCYENSIESLFPKNNVEVRVLAMLVRGAKEDFVAEDLTGSVQLDFSEELSVGENGENNASTASTTTSSIFASPALYFEGGIYAFEGVHVAGRLRVKRVSLPPLCANAFGNTDVKRKYSTDPNDRLVFLSDVLLDDPKVMKALYQILSGFSVCPPNVFVLCGRFLRTQLAYGYTEASRNAFRHLANLLAEFSTYFTNTHFVLVPSLDDPLLVNILPCFSLPPTIMELFSAMSNVHFASNPCRIFFKGQSILVLRDDLVEKLCRTSIHVTEHTKEIHEHFCNTIWAQRHLSSLPLYLNPILPQFDYLFGLWPAPDVLVIADKFKSFSVTENEQRRFTFNPGSFSLSNFEFQVFYPALNRVEVSSLSIE